MDANKTLLEWKFYCLYEQTLAVTCASETTFGNSRENSQDSCHGPWTQFFRTVGTTIREANLSYNAACNLRKSGPRCVHWWKVLRKPRGPKAKNNSSWNQHWRRKEQKQNREIFSVWLAFFSSRFLHRANLTFCTVSRCFMTHLFFLPSVLFELPLKFG